MSTRTGFRTLLEFFSFFHTILTLPLIVQFGFVYLAVIGYRERYMIFGFRPRIRRVTHTFTPCTVILICLDSVITKRFSVKKSPAFARDQQQRKRYKLLLSSISPQTAEQKNDQTV